MISGGTHDCFGSTTVSGPGQCVDEFGDRPRNLRHPIRQGLPLRQMNDERMVRRPALHGEHPTDGIEVAGVGGQSVDGLGRHPHQPAGAAAPPRPCGVAQHPHR